MPIIYDFKEGKKTTFFQLKKRGEGRFIKLNIWVVSLAKQGTKVEWNSTGDGLENCVAEFEKKSAFPSC